MKKTILYISPGPNMGVHSVLYQSQYKEISKTYKGYIFTIAYKKERVQIYDFAYLSMKFSSSKLRVLKFLFFCIWNVLKILIRKEKIDLVSTYDPLSTGVIGVVVAGMLRTKFAPEVKGVYTSPSEWLDNADALETKLKKTIYPMIMRFVLKRADGIRVLFKGQLDPFEKIIQGKIIHDFHSFVPIESFKNIREDKEVLFVGFPFKRKGVDILIEAFKKIALYNPLWKLKILGWYPNPEELNNAIGGHPQIYHHNPVPHSEMPTHIGTCGILVLPSRSEAMGRVLVEAMAAGKPRIGSNVDGIPTVIKDNVDGLLCNPENVDDLADKLHRLMNDPDLRQRLGKAAEKRAKEEFTKEAYCKNLLHFYKEVLEK